MVTICTSSRAFNAWFNTHAVESASAPDSDSSVTCTASSAPMASALRSAASAAAGPTVSATTRKSLSGLSSRRRNACSTEYSLISSMTLSTDSRSSVKSSSNDISDQVSGTCLTKAAMVGIRPLPFRFY